MSNDHFSIVDDAIGPQPWMQLRRLIGKEAASVSRSYATSGGGNKNDLVQTVDVAWTNNAPIAQDLYGMVTRGGAQVTLQARSRGYLTSLHAAQITNSPTTPTTFDLFEISRFGCGLDVGMGGMLAMGTSYATQEHRQHSTTIPLMPHETGLYRVEPGQTFHARVMVRFVTQFWENTAIDGGAGATESGFISGDTRVDLFALPSVGVPVPRPIPSVVGVGHHIAVTSGTVVNVPAGVAAGDVLLAVVANQFGFATDITAGQSGWTQLHARDAGIANAHLKVFWRIATGTEPATYSFGNGFAAEETAALIAVRNASPNMQDGWSVASALRRHWWERDDGHAAPSIDSRGQMLLCVSYVPYSPGQDPITQTPPTGMTELLDVNGAISSMAIAQLVSPPRPTEERKFVTSKTPQWAGQSVSLSILIPGVLD